MRATRMYTGKDGHSHFEVLELPSQKTEGGGEIIELPGTAGMFIRVIPESTNPAAARFHGATRRQYAINLAGTMEIWLRDGSKATIGPGEILLSEEERDGEGHAAATVGGTRITLNIPVTEPTPPTLH